MSESATGALQGRYTMQVVISEGDISFCALLGADIRRFLSLLGSQEAVGIDQETGDPLLNPFDEVHLHTTWGLLVLVFHSPQGRVTKAMNIDLLTVTKELVISNDGKPVDRYVRVIEELLRLAVAQLHTSPSALPLIRPGKDVVGPTLITSSKPSKGSSKRSSKLTKKAAVPYANGRES